MKLKFTWRKKSKPGRQRKRIGLSPQAVYLVTIGVISAGLLFAMYGAYQIINRALTTSEVIIQLRPEVTDEIFRSDDFIGVIELLDQKVSQKEPADWGAVVNPFSADRPSPPAASPLISPLASSTTPTTTPP